MLKNRGRGVVEGERVLTGVRAAVLAEVTGDGEGLAAVRAYVGPLPGVRARVLLQVALRRPALPAHGADVGPLAGVQADVHHQARQRGERLPAVLAAEGLLPVVVLQPAARPEALAALGAEVGLRGRVAPGVHL